MSPSLHHFGRPSSFMISAESNQQMAAIMPSWGLIDANNVSISLSFFNLQGDQKPCRHLMMTKKRKSITTTAKRKSRTRSQSVVLLEPRKAIKPPRRRSGGGGGGSATATITRTTASSSSRGKAKHPRLSSASSKANRISRVRDVSYFERLPSDVIGRILFSGYFDSVTVLTRYVWCNGWSDHHPHSIHIIITQWIHSNRHALVDKKIRSLAEVYYASLDLHKVTWWFTSPSILIIIIRIMHLSYHYILRYT